MCKWYYTTQKIHCQLANIHLNTFLGINRAARTYIDSMKEIKEQPIIEQKFTSHRFDMNDRKKASLTGVNKVESSNATELILHTCLGKLEIRGTDLKISRFDVADGSLTMTGNIDSVKYAAPKQSLVKRIFK